MLEIFEWTIAIIMVIVIIKSFSEPKSIKYMGYEYKDWDDVNKCWRTRKEHK